MGLAERVTQRSENRQWTRQKWQWENGITAGEKRLGKPRILQTIFFKKQNYPNGRNMENAWGELRQKCIQNFTPKMTTEITFGRTRC